MSLEASPLWAGETPPQAPIRESPEDRKARLKAAILEANNGPLSFGVLGEATKNQFTTFQINHVLGLPERTVRALFESLKAKEGRTTAEEKELRLYKFVLSGNPADLLPPQPIDEELTHPTGVVDLHEEVARLIEGKPERQGGVEELLRASMVDGSKTAEGDLSTDRIGKAGELKILGEELPYRRNEGERIDGGGFAGDPEMQNFEERMGGQGAVTENTPSIEEGPSVIPRRPMRREMTKESRRSEIDLKAGEQFMLYSPDVGKEVVYEIAELNYEGKPGRVLVVPKRGFWGKIFTGKNVGGLVVEDYKFERDAEGALLYNSQKKPPLKQGVVVDPWQRREVRPVAIPGSRYWKEQE